MKTTEIGFIGGGRITNIFLQALASQKESLNVVVCDTNPDVLNDLKKAYPYISIQTTPEQAAKQALVFIALHPPVMGPMLSELAAFMQPDTLVVSLAPKITVSKMASVLNTTQIARMIPNATSYVQAGFNPIYFSPALASDKKDLLTTLLKPMGSLIETAENKLEAYALISAMLPTYFWFQWKTIAELGEQMGLNKSECTEALKETLQGAISLYFDAGLTPEKAIDLIPVKPIGEHEAEISDMYRTKLLGLYEKIKPEQP